MNAVQIIHKHIMLRFCVVLLAVFVAFGAFTSTCFADDPLSRQITVAVGGTIGSGLGSLAGGSIAAAGVSAVGLPAAAPIASKVGSGLVGSAGGVVGGLFAGKLYDFLTGYDGDANEDSFETAYDSWLADQDAMPSASNNDYSFYLVPVNSAYNSSDGRYYYYFSDFVTPCDGIWSTYLATLLFVTSKETYCPDFDTIINNCQPFVYRSAGYTYSFEDGWDSNLMEPYIEAMVLKNVDNFSNYHNYRIGSVSSATSVASALINNIGSGSVTVGCIDESLPDKANNFYTLPLVDENENKLILPDGSVIDFDGMLYDYIKCTYYITYDTSKTYQITYNYDNCVVNNGTASNIYYYATVDANTPTYDKDGNQTGGSTTNPSNPDPSNPDTPSGGDDNSSSIWDRVVDAIAGLFTAIGKVIGGLLESVVNLFTGIVDGLTGCLDLFGSFGEFVAGFYTWMPEEWRTVLAAAFTIFIGLAVVKLFRGS